MTRKVFCFRGESKAVAGFVSMFGLGKCGKVKRRSKTFVELEIEKLPPKRRKEVEKKAAEIIKRSGQTYSRSVKRRIVAQLEGDSSVGKRWLKKE